MHVTNRVHDSIGNGIGVCCRTDSGIANMVLTGRYNKQEGRFGRKLFTSGQEKNLQRGTFRRLTDGHLFCIVVQACLKSALLAIAFSLVTQV